VTKSSRKTGPRLARATPWQFQKEQTSKERRRARAMPGSMRLAPNPLIREKECAYFVRKCEHMEKEVRVLRRQDKGMNKNKERVTLVHINCEITEVKDSKEGKP